MKIGLSVSLCVKDILEGRVNIGDVTVIVANTKCATDKDFDLLYRAYLLTFWSGYAMSAKVVLNQLRLEGKLVQPRLENPDYQHKSEPCWITVESSFYGAGDPRQTASVPA